MRVPATEPNCCMQPMYPSTSLAHHWDRMISPNLGRLPVPPHILPHLCPRDLFFCNTETTPLRSTRRSALVPLVLYGMPGTRFVERSPLKSLTNACSSMRSQKMIPTIVAHYVAIQSTGQLLNAFTDDYNIYSVMPYYPLDLR